MARNRSEKSVVKQVVVSTTCDNCGKTERGPTTYSGDADTPVGWVHFHSYHNDWGNDSIESHEDWDACSWNCYLEVVRRIFDEYGDGKFGSNTLVVDSKDWTFIRDLLTTHLVKP
jgi:hypothetical protein